MGGSKDEQKVQLVAQEVEEKTNEFKRSEQFKIAADQKFKELKAEKDAANAGLTRLEVTRKNRKEWKAEQITLPQKAEQLVIQEYQKDLLQQLQTASQKEPTEQVQAVEEQVKSPTLSDSEDYIQEETASHHSEDLEIPEPAAQEQTSGARRALTAEELRIQNEKLDKEAKALEAAEKARMASRIKPPTPRRPVDALKGQEEKDKVMSLKGSDVLIKKSREVEKRKVEPPPAKKTEEEQVAEFKRSDQFKATVDQKFKELKAEKDAANANAGRTRLEVTRQNRKEWKAEQVTLPQKAERIVIDDYRRNLQSESANEAMLLKRVANRPGSDAYKHHESQFNELARRNLDAIKRLRDLDPAKNSEELQQVRMAVNKIRQKGEDQGIHEPQLYKSVQVVDTDGWSTLAETPMKTEYEAIYSLEDEQKITKGYQDSLSTIDPEYSKLRDRLEELEQLHGENNDWQPLKNLQLQQLRLIKDMRKEVKVHTDFMDQTEPRVRIYSDDFDKQGAMTSRAKQELDAVGFSPNDIQHFETLHGIGHCLKEKCPESLKSGTWYKNLIELTSVDSKSVGEVRGSIQKATKSIEVKIKQLERDIQKVDDDVQVVQSSKFQKKTGFSGFLDFLKNIVSAVQSKMKGSKLSFTELRKLEEGKAEREHEQKKQTSVSEMSAKKDTFVSMKKTLQEIKSGDPKKPEQPKPEEGERHLSHP